MPDLPFQVGELAESRCFQYGFRGAWFRCKIRGIRMKNADVTHLLEYFDYPDQRITWIKLYQKPLISKSKGHEKELILRPPFPTVYRENENFDVNTISKVIVIVDNVWKVGDLVDWYTDGCYWSGRVTKILGNDEVQIDLLPPPLGEGNSYRAFSKDLRPSLDWCPEKGWTVPMPMLQEGGCSRPCAHIVNPANSGDAVNIHATDGTVKVDQTTLRTFSSHSTQNFEGPSDSVDRSMARRKQCNTVRNGDAVNIHATDGTVKVDQTTVRTFSSHSTQNFEGPSDSLDRSMARRKQCNTFRNGMDNDLSDDKIGRTSFSVENSEKATINGGYDEYPTEKLRSNISLCLNSMSSNTTEAAIMDLEELLNRIKWLRDVLNLGVPLSDTKQPSWEFSQHAPCK
ncbi:uncharacterized protein LOC113865394 isoform X1 [Abrus precatorius]|uniref:Uncharacterized protein LOC113865394 isoform X1 n=1 Tax=Abrus precatorius TaxID=3816 RepID=A0A8B8LLJ1_ABRPR|nr:uncharacterized protein LOC113865394 isoform X1 [Abrus precatorius]